MCYLLFFCVTKTRSKVVDSRTRMQRRVAAAARVRSVETGEAAAAAVEMGAGALAEAGEAAAVAETGAAAAAEEAGVGAAAAEMGVAAEAEKDEEAAAAETRGAAEEKGAGAVVGSSGALQVAAAT